MCKKKEINDILENNKEEPCLICEAMDKWEKMGLDIPKKELLNAFKKQAKINKAKGIPSMINGKIY